MKETKKTTGPGVHSLPEERWPAAERAAWEEARRPSVRLQRGGAASHLRPVVQRDLGKRNGLFLESVSRSGRLDMNAPAGAHVTPENVEGYVAELKGRVSSVTVYGSIQKLRRFVQLIAPERDLGWLIEIERQLYSERRPRPKWDRVVTTDVLVDAGRTLMAEAEIAKRPKLTPRQNVPQRPYGRASRLLSDPPEELRGPRNRPQLCQCRWHMVDCTHGGRNEGKEGGRAAGPGGADSFNRALSGDLQTHPGRRKSRG